MTYLPLLVVTHWRPPVFGLEELGYQQCGSDFYEMGMDDVSADDEVERMREAGAMGTEPEMKTDDKPAPDDPIYEGFRITEYWMVTTLAPDNREGVLFVDEERADRFKISMGLAMASDEVRLANLRDFAQAAANEFGVELSIRHFVAADRESIYPTTVRSDESV